MIKDIYNTKNLLNVDILVLTDQMIKFIGEVKTGDIFESGTKIFKRDGLYSNEIFGPTGSAIRQERYGYIKLNIPILHPFVYLTLLSLASKYEGIINGTKYAKFNNNTKDFEFTDIKNGETGYNFFLKHVNKIKFKETNSDQRSYRIKFVTKYTQPQYMIDKWIVIPAGLRDCEEDENGHISEDEINDFYRKLINTANSVKNFNIDSNLDLLNPIRVKLQNTACEIFEYIRNLIQGKTKFTEGKFAKRAVTYGTRNVITPIPAKIQSLKDKDIIDINKSTIGLYQYIKSINPVTIHRVRTMFINNVFNPNNNSAYLVNPKTMKTELVNINTKRKDEWLTLEGINNTISKLSNKTRRFDPVIVDGYYMFVVVDTGKQIVIYEDTNDIPEDTNPNFIRPLTYCELFYLAIYDVKDKYPGYTTRYPVTGLGSIYPTYPYVKTTARSRIVNVRYKTWIRDVIEYPILGELFIESFSPSTQHLARLSGDYDGDMLSYTSLLTEESIEEVNKFLNSKEAYITTTNEITYSSSDDVVDIVMKVLTE